MADPDLKEFLTKLKLRQATLKKDREERIQDIAQRGGVPPLKRRLVVHLYSSKLIQYENMPPERLIARNVFWDVDANE